MPYIKQMPSKQPVQCNILHPHLSLLCRPGEMLPPMRQNLTYSTHVALKQEAKRAAAQEQTGRRIPGAELYCNGVLQGRG